jgi:condensin-2 complex subunit D3
MPHATRALTACFTRLAQAADAAATLLAALPRAETGAFVSFLGRLSRSPTAAHRGFAADLAPVLLAALPEPFAPAEPWTSAPTPGTHAGSAGAARTPGTCGLTPRGAMDTDGDGDGEAAALLSPALPAGVTPGTPAAGPRQPWGVVCMQLLLQRASDKVPAVRARALTGLAAAAGRAPDAAEEAAALAQLLGGGAGSVTASAAHAHTGDAAHMRMPMGGAATPGSGLRAAAGGGVFGGGGATPGTLLFLRRCGRTPGAESDAAGSSAAGSSAAGSVAPPSPVSAELGALLRLRCADEKGGVRRAALAALEAVALATHALPRDDVAALAAACGDALLSVRRAAHGALCRLLAAQPDAPGLAHAWLTAALPLTADTEPSVSDRALDALDDMLLAGLAAAGKRGAAAVGAAAVADALLRALADAHDALPPLADAIAALARRGRIKGAALTALQVRLRGVSPGARDAAGAWALLGELTEACPSAADVPFLGRAWQHAVASRAPTATLLRAVAHAAPAFAPDAAAALAAQLEARVAAFALPPDEAAAHLRALAPLAARAAGGAAGDAASAWASRLLRAACDALEAHLSCRHTGAAAASAATAALFAAGATALLSPSAVRGELVTLVQALVAGGAEGGSGSGVGGATCADDALSAHAWATLSKLCLADERLAKRCVPLFVRELSSGARRSAAVRNNLLLGLSDLCAAHTSLVDPHALRLAACAADPCELVRRQALSLLASLLARDYLKWRGPLFVRFAAALADPAPGVRARAAALLAHPQLAPRVPALAYAHFTEALFAMNGFDAAGRPPAVPEKAAGVLRGCEPAARAGRLEVLRALLRAMSPEHRLATAAKLCAEVLVPCAEGVLALPACDEVLVDALSALAAKEMSFKAPPATRVGADDADDGEEGAHGGRGGGALASAKARAVCGLARRNLVENFVPVLIELKRALAAARSRLLPHLMACARGALRDLRAELEDILVADRQLAAELLFDLRAEEAHATHAPNNNTAAAAQGAAAAAAAAAAAMPPPPARRGAAARGGGGMLSPAPAAAAAVERTPRRAGARRVSLAGVDPSATPAAAEVLMRAPPSQGGAAAAAAVRAAAAATLSVPRLRATTPRTTGPHAVDAAALADVCRRQSFSEAQVAHAFSGGDENASARANSDAAAAAQLNMVCLMSPDKPAPSAAQLNMPPPPALAASAEDGGCEGGASVSLARGAKRGRV